MLVGFDAKRAFCNTTGLGNYSRLLVSSLADRYPDFRALLYSPQVKTQYGHFFDSYSNVAVCCPTGPYRAFPHLWRSAALSCRLASDRVDLFHGLSHELPLGLPASVPGLVTMHDLIAWRYPQYFGLADAKIHQLKQRHACRVADVVVAISQQTRRDLIDIMQVPPDKICVLYQSCDPMFWRPVSAEDVAAVRTRYALPERYVVCIGTIEQRKNQLSVVRAMSLLPDDVHLLLVGRQRGAYADEVLREVQRLRLSRRVRILSHVAFSDFPALYACSLASVYLSRFEGFGIPVLEALCSGAAVVTSPCSSLPEVGGDAVLYADPDDVDALARHILRLAHDNMFRASLLGKVQHQVSQFSIPATAAACYDLYRQLLQR